MGRAKKPCMEFGVAIETCSWPSGGRGAGGASWGGGWGRGGWGRGKAEACNMMHEANDLADTVFMHGASKQMQVKPELAEPVPCAAQQKANCQHNKGKSKAASHGGHALIEQADQGLTYKLWHGLNSICTATAMLPTSLHKCACQHPVILNIHLIYHGNCLTCETVLSTAAFAIYLAAALP